MSQNSARYTGRRSQAADRACHLVAGKLRDRYQSTEGKLARRKFVNFDYFGVIAAEETRDKTLVAFDESWVLPAISSYISGDNTYQTERDEVLREKIASIVSRDPNTTGVWTTIPALTRGSDLSLADLSLYSFNDFDINPRTLYMVFAPVSTDEAEKIFVYTYRDARLYNFSVYVAVRDMPLAEAQDFAHLNPVKLDFIGNYAVFSSEQMTQDTLDQIYLFNEYPFPFPRLDELKGAYASYLLSESLYYEFSIRWENRILYIGLAGWIQAQDIMQQFTRILNDVDRERVKFRLLLGFNEAVRISQSSTIKSFYHAGEYYAATCSEVDDCDLPDVSNQSLGVDPSAVELFGPLQAPFKGKDMRAQALEYLSLLGYRIEPNPEPYFNGLSLGHVTYQVEATGQTFTKYYYVSTNGENLVVHEITGPHRKEVQAYLETLLNEGELFDQKQRNLTRGYPDFVPSTLSVDRHLSADPSQLVK